LDKTAARIRSLGLENDGRSRQLARYVKKLANGMWIHLEVRLVYRNDRFLRGGDHTPFVENGYPAVRITEMNENYHRQHQDVRTERGVEYGDLEKFMDYEYLRKNTAVNVAALASLAKAPPPPQAVTINVKDLTNVTTLDWKHQRAAGQKATLY
jgi:hypothetical protein